VKNRNIKTLVVLGKQHFNYRNFSHFFISRFLITNHFYGRGGKPLAGVPEGLRDFFKDLPRDPEALPGVLGRDCESLPRVFGGDCEPLLGVFGLDDLVPVAVGLKLTNAVAGFNTPFRLFSVPTFASATLLTYKTSFANNSLTRE
jgi:hypothetical protein